MVDVGNDANLIAETGEGREEVGEFEVAPGRLREPAAGMQAERDAEAQQTFRGREECCRSEGGRKRDGFEEREGNRGADTLEEGATSEGGRERRAHGRLGEQ